MAPPVEEIAAWPGGGAVMADQTLLERGRDVYVRRCSGCHTIFPVDDYPMDEWHEIIIDMGIEADLSGSETRSLRAYIEAAHAYMLATPNRGEPVVDDGV